MDVIYLDFDGVLHDDEVFISKGGKIECRTPGRTLFEWEPILVDLLAPYPDLKIVLSTSWVVVKSFSFAKKQLSPALANRVIGATFHSFAMSKDEFSNRPRGEQVRVDIHRRQPSRWFAIDNDSSGWRAEMARVALTTSHLGLSDPEIQNDIRCRLENKYFVNPNS